MKITRKFSPSDRYTYDCGLCSIQNGFAQIDTAQDAPYFGTWASPTKLTIVSYCEGDVIIQQADNEREFVEAVVECALWNIQGGYGFGIDPGVNHDAPIGAAFRRLGLGHFLH